MWRGGPAGAEVLVVWSFVLFFVVEDMVLGVNGRPFSSCYEHKYLNSANLSQFFP